MARRSCVRINLVAAIGAIVMACGGDDPKVTPPVTSPDQTSLEVVVTDTALAAAMRIALGEGRGPGSIPWRCCISRH